MDAEWLCDEEMDRQEEEYRQECHAAAHDFLVQSFLPEVDEPPEEDFNAPPDEHDLACIDAQVHFEGNSSMARSTLPVPATEGLQALTPKREAHGAARQFTCDDASEVLLPEQTEDFTPCKVMRGLAGAKLPLSSKGSARMDATITAETIGHKRRRLVGKQPCPLSAAASPTAIPGALLSTSETPVSVKDRNKLWNFVYSKLRGPYKDSEAYKALDWNTGESRYSIMRKGLRDFWAAQPRKMKAQWIREWMLDVSDRQLRSFLTWLHEKLNSGSDELRPLAAKYRLSMGFLTWVNKKWRVPLPLFEKEGLSADAAAEHPAVVAAGMKLGNKLHSYAESFMQPVLGYKHFAMCVELCCKTYEAEYVLQLHLHMFWFDAPDKRMQP